MRQEWIYLIHTMHAFFAAADDAVLVATSPARKVETGREMSPVISFHFIPPEHVSVSITEPTPEAGNLSSKRCILERLGAGNTC